MLRFVCVCLCVRGCVCVRECVHAMPVMQRLVPCVLRWRCAPVVLIVCAPVHVWISRGVLSRCATWCAHGRLRCLFPTRTPTPTTVLQMSANARVLSSATAGAGSASSDAAAATGGVGVGSHGDGGSASGDEGPEDEALVTIGGQKVWGAEEPRAAACTPAVCPFIAATYMPRVPRWGSPPPHS